MAHQVHASYMKLYLFIDSNDEELKRQYAEHVQKHNEKMNDAYYDAGFDILTPDDYISSQPYQVLSVDFKIKCKAEINGMPTPFYTYARSSISKTHLRLANNQGIIDAGYRGNLIGKFDIISVCKDNKLTDKYSRLLQICGPSLQPIYVEIVNNLEDLGPSTRRGDGGFGSTGK